MMMNLVQVTLGLLLIVVALSSPGATLRHFLVTRQSREPGLDEDARLIKLPEVSFECTKPGDEAERLRSTFRGVLSQDSRFDQLYPCGKEGRGAFKFVSYRITKPRDVTLDWTRIVYRVIVRLASDREDMLFVEVFAPGGGRARIMAIRNRMTSVDLLPERVEHSIKGCPKHS